MARINSTPTGATSPTFAYTAGSVSTDSSPSALALGDVNGDRKPDLLVTARGASTVNVFINTTANGATTPTFGLKHAFALNLTANESPSSIDTADLDGDGKLDIIVADYLGNDIAALRNTATLGESGSFTPSFAIAYCNASINRPFNAIAVDFDGDGKPDIASINPGAASPNIRVFGNQSTPGSLSFIGSGSNQVLIGSQSPNMRYLAAADLDNDGRRDLIVALFTPTNEIRVMRNTSSPGAMSFDTGALVFASGENPAGLHTADIDGDGRIDVIEANNNSTASGGPTWHRNITPPGGPIALGPGQPLNTSDVTLGLTSADINADGRPDLVSFTNSASNAVSLLLSTQYRVNRVSGNPATGTICHDTLFADGFE